MSGQASHDHDHGHAGGGDGHGGGEHHEHIHPPSHYVKIWGALCGLLVLSVAGPFVADIIRDAQPTVALVLVLVTAFGIAFVKAGMVVKYFMHLDTEKPFVWYFLITCLVFMVLFFAATSPDILNHEGTRWDNVAAKAEVERGHKWAAENEGHGHEGGGEHGATPGGEHGAPPAGGEHAPAPHQGGEGH